MKECQRRGVKVAQDVPGSQLTSFRLGGALKVLISPETLEEVLFVWNLLHEEGLPFFLLGAGTNLLLRDGGFAGIGLSLKELRGLEIRDEGDSLVLKAMAGEPLRSLVSLGLRYGLSGIEYLAGIPGTVGGAIFMNAGVSGGSVSGWLEEVILAFPGHVLRMFDCRQLSFSYRRSLLPDGALILGGVFRFPKGGRKTVTFAVREVCRRRVRTQPLRYPSAGCIFKNPPGEAAGRLIDLCGLKGRRLGGAMISPKHANFIVNCSSARASDVLGLMDLAREAVFREFSLELETEVRILGQG